MWAHYLFPSWILKPSNSLLPITTCRVWVLLRRSAASAADAVNPHSNHIPIPPSESALFFIQTHTHNNPQQVDFRSTVMDQPLLWFTPKRFLHQDPHREIKVPELPSTLTEWVWTWLKERNNTFSLLFHLSQIFSWILAWNPNPIRLNTHPFIPASHTYEFDWCKSD